MKDFIVFHVSRLTFHILRITFFMKSDPLYHKFIKQWEEVTQIPPQTVGPLTPVYKRTVVHLKVAPWRIIVPAVFIITAFIALVLEVTAVQVASILQKGF